MNQSREKANLFFKAHGNHQSGQTYSAGSAQIPMYGELKTQLSPSLQHVPVRPAPRLSRNVLSPMHCVPAAPQVCGGVLEKSAGLVVSFVHFAKAGFKYWQYKPSMHCSAVVPVGLPPHLHQQLAWIPCILWCSKKAVWISLLLCRIVQLPMQYSSCAATRIVRKAHFLCSFTVLGRVSWLLTAAEVVISADFSDSSSLVG